MRTLKSFIKNAFQLVSAMSLLAFLAIVALWIRSYWISDGFSCEVHDGYEITVQFRTGGAFVWEKWLPVESEQSSPIKFTYVISPVLPFFFDNARSFNYGVNQNFKQELADQKNRIDQLDAYLKNQPANDNPHVASDLNYEIFRIKQEGVIARIIAARLWAIAGIFAGIPLAHAWAIVRRRRILRQGHCRVCGYDLRATPDRCPECGTATIKPAEIQIPNRGVGSV